MTRSSSFVHSSLTTEEVKFPVFVRRRGYVRFVYACHERITRRYFSFILLSSHDSPFYFLPSIFLRIKCRFRFLRVCFHQVHNIRFVLLDGRTIPTSKFPRCRDCALSSYLLIVDAGDLNASSPIERTIKMCELGIRSSSFMTLASFVFATDTGKEDNRGVGTVIT